MCHWKNDSVQHLERFLVNKIINQTNSAIVKRDDLYKTRTDDKEKVVPNATSNDTKLIYLNPNFGEISPLIGSVNQLIGLDRTR